MSDVKRINTQLTGTQRSEWIPVRGDFSVSISGTFTGDATVERRFSPTGTPLTIESYSAPFQDTGNEPADSVEYSIVADLSAGAVDVILASTHVKWKG